MSEKSERLFEAMSELKDATVDQGVESPPARRRFRWKRWTALAACLALVVGLGAAGVLRLPTLGGAGAGPAAGEGGETNGGAGGSGHDGGTVFMSYAGPVFPLTLLEGNDSITAERTVTLDFSGGAETDRRNDITVTDAYQLTNGAQEDQTVTVLYPFAASLGSLDEYRPVLTLDGAALETGLAVGGYAGGFQGTEGPGSPGSVNLHQAQSWEDYKALLSDGSYLAGALTDGPDVHSVPVTVYRFTDPYGPERDGDAGIPNPTIRAYFDLDYDETTVLTWGFHGARYDREGGTMIQEFSIPMSWGREDGPFYLLVLGEDIEDLTTRGYVTGGTDADTPTLEGCGGTVERYESDLDTMLREILTPEWEERSQGSYRQDDLRLGIDFETFYRAFLEHLLSYGVLSPQAAERYDGAWLEDMVQDVTVVDRVCWVTAQVTVPAGGSVTVAASMAKGDSYDFYCGHTENQGVSGYDLVTALGSNLTFTGQTAALTGWEEMEIVRQNFGFDPENGVTSVTLDPGEEHYYLEVRRAAE